MPALFSMVSCLTSKTLRTTLPSSFISCVGHAGNVDGLLQLAFEALAILRRVFGDEDAFGVERNGEEVGHLEQDADGLLRRGRRFEIEANDSAEAQSRRRWRGCRSWRATCWIDGLDVGVKVEALEAGVGLESDWAGDGGDLA